VKIVIKKQKNASGGVRLSESAVRPGVSHHFPKILNATEPLTYAPRAARRFVTFEEEDSVNDIFKTGIMHMLGGKQVRVAQTVRLCLDVHYTLHLY
jgi:hypothetical protein